MQVLCQINEILFWHTIAERLLGSLNPNCRINLYSLHMGPVISPTHCQCPFLRFCNLLFFYLKFCPVLSLQLFRKI